MVAQPYVEGDVQPFLSNYSRNRVALRCHGCNTVYFPGIWGPGECPFCHGQHGGEPLLSLFEPSQTFGGKVQGDR